MRGTTGDSATLVLRVNGDIAINLQSRALINGFSTRLFEFTRFITHLTFLTTQRDAFFT
jgi:hypothetical protein